MTYVSNLIPDPQFAHVQTSYAGNVWHSVNSTTQLDRAQNALTVTNNAGNSEPCVELYLSDLSAYHGVNMTFACKLSWIPGSATECGNGLIRLFVKDKFWKVSDGGTATVGRKALQFTVPDDTTGFGIRLYAPAAKGSAFQWWHPILTRTADYQRLQSLGVDYFDGDTMPKIE
ncbi:hypothetical protein [Bifidobacterium boum]|uniref:hypothetical protein n=1 Tax=Bifidobacterium boum TaxID=78343 RepID=UPI002432044A|nr:hypothetical protein [Bifidobacterium boum]MCI5861961.1 hypothetical protein [Bifidobacterium boum]